MINERGERLVLFVKKESGLSQWVIKNSSGMVTKSRIQSLSISNYMREEDIRYPTEMIALLPEVREDVISIEDFELLGKMGIKRFYELKSNSGVVFFMKNIETLYENIEGVIVPFKLRDELMEKVVTRRQCYIDVDESVDFYELLDAIKDIRGSQYRGVIVDEKFLKRYNCYASLRCLKEIILNNCTWERAIKLYQIYLMEEK